MYCTSRYCKLGPFNLQRSQDSKACCDLWVNRARMLLARWKGARLWVELLFLWTSAKLGSLKIIVRESKCNLAILHVPPELALFGKQNFFFFLSEFHIPICCETFHGTSFRQGETNFHGFFICYLFIYLFLQERWRSRLPVCISARPYDSLLLSFPVHEIHGWK